jgi:hypothetical protein
MSYDLMVFDPAAAPQKRAEFMEWYEEQVKWSEDHSYEDHSVTSEILQNWFLEMIQHFPAMNGPLASGEDDEPTVTDYCIGRSVIYTAFAWSCAESAYQKMRELAVKHQVGFFDVSAEEGEILFPNDKSKPWWKIW